MPTYTSTDANGDVLLALVVPEAEYMYGCTPTAVAMVLGYYDLYGYRGADLSNMIEGDVDSKSRGTDGNAYNMNAFDTVLGRATATESFVSRFHSRGGKETTPAQELKYSFKSDNKTIDTSNWDCIADYLGTGQYWRGNDNLSTTISYSSLEDIFKNASYLEITAGSTTRNVRHVDTTMLYGLDLYVQSRGYALDYEITGTYVVDVAGGSFTFADYMNEIDSGRPVMVSISGHSMVGYGYNAGTQEIIFDDCYVSGRRMQWGGTYRFDKVDRPLQAITVIGINVNGSVDLAFDNIAGSDWNKLIVAGAPDTTESADYCFAGDTVFLSFTVSNLGTKESGEFGVSVFVDGIPVSSSTNGSISGESARTVTGIPLSELAVGMHNVRVVLDEGNEVQELSGSNNAAETDILVLKPGTTVVAMANMVVVDSKENVQDCYVQGGANLTLKDGTASGTVLRGLVTESTSESIRWIPGEFIVSQGGQASATNVFGFGNFYVSSGGTAADTSVFSRGSAFICDGGTASNAVVASGGRLIVEPGGRLTGQVTLENGASAWISGGGIMDFDLSGAAPGGAAFLNDFSLFKGNPVYTLTVSGSQAHGSYRLADGVGKFSKSISVRGTDGTMLGSLTTGTTVCINDSDYLLKLNDGALTLTVSEHVPVDAVAPTVSNIRADVTEPTCGRVVLTADYHDDVALASKLYRIGANGEWLEYADGVTVEDNATVYFKAVDTSDNESVVASRTVSNIVSSGFVLSEGKTAAVLPGRTLTDTVVSGGLLHVSAGGTAAGITVEAGGGMYVFAGGSATGRMVFAPDAGVFFEDGSTLDFDISNLKPGADARAKGLSCIQGSPLFTLTVSGTQAKGLYILADDAPEFETSLSVLDAAGAALGTFSVGQSVDINGTGYSLNLSDRVLTLTVGAAGTANHADCGWNNKLCENKTPNPKIKDTVPAALTSGTMEEILLDSEGSVSKDGRRNFVGFGDVADYAKITLDHAAKLSFLIDATDAAKFIIQKLVEGKDGKYTVKTLQTTAILKKNRYSGKTGSLMLERGDYYISMQSTNAKKGGAAYYKVTLDQDACCFYDDGDDGWNNGPLLDKKLPSEKTAAFLPVTITGTATETPVQFDNNFGEDGKLRLNKDYSNFVGFGDTSDFVKLSATQPVQLSFTVRATGNVKLKVYSLSRNAKTGAWVMKTLQTVTLNVNKGDSASSQKAIRLDRLGVGAAAGDPAGYYVSVESTDKKGNAYYSVTVDSKLYGYADFGTNGSPLDAAGKIKTGLRSTEIAGEQKRIDMEVDLEGDSVTIGETVDGRTYTGFVGFGDEYDCAELVFFDKGTVTLAVETCGTGGVTSKLALFQYTLKNGKWAKSSVGTLSVKTDKDTKAGSNSRELKVKEATGATVRYFVVMQAGSAKKDTEVYYNAFASFAPANSSALEMPEMDDRSASASDIGISPRQNELTVARTDDTFSSAAADTGCLPTDSSLFKQDSLLLA
ncbi:MAG: hypothetical protein IKQ16_03395 [Lentisphaeria bacterium]|nr:hypothetical protein [Lentisphaeria bacterium]